MNEPALLTLDDYARAYQSGATTPAQAIADVYRRIAAHDDPAIFITLRPEADCAREAEALPARRGENLPLYGIPVAVKDNIDVAGVPTTAACPDFATTPDEDAAVVARLRAAGAIVIGKTNLDQFATGLVGVRSPYGVPRNALRGDLVPGGSSSGSAVAVAAGLVPIALGTDTAGSGRVPAGLNGIVGLKPTVGALSTRGVVPACRSLDCVSVFALTVADAFAVFHALAAFDEADPFSRRLATGQMSAPPPVLRIGVPNADTLSFGGDDAARSAFEANCSALGHDAALSRVSIAPLHDAAALLYHGPWVAERHAAIRTFFDRQPQSLLPVTRGIVESAARFSATDAFMGHYRLAELRREAEKLFRTIDVLAVPTFPRARTLADLAADPLGPNTELGTYTNGVNLLDLCALAIPSGMTVEGMPTGLTLIAPAGRDALLASLGATLHARLSTSLGATSRPVPPASDPATRAVGDEIELAVVGAHLSGLPLNGELTSLGARFLRAVPTSADYRLFALPGGPPFRPGLMRVDAGAGQAIDTEIWALSPDSFGRFVAGIPSPLGIGTLILSDGSRVKGFVVEHTATMGARDISAYGGWRAFVADRAA